MIGGAVGSVVGFLLVIVLPVIIFFCIHKRKQGGLKSRNTKIRPLDEEPRPWSFTAHEAPASIPPPPAGVPREPYAYIPPAPQLGGGIPTATPLSMPRPVYEALSTPSTPSSASAMPLQGV
ncbi:hypothetical protein DUNSADRAFT_1134 [Dunaliella salina]|nr:hypothetical protein DUNSADRAFT_1134 [Dunaliella salina]|eukprot:KAF5827208.1 hypothetical protein DUNSADRAFT_1134 [Dunaliella salina]